ncbi:XapX domain-containing protein [Bacillus sp. Marseille-Q3570]|uniref:XapX domain-containing protein n=1 Tax=Bacillus sp. Marseille-Q3570 TaxID=2963522 RepID=UPI0021B83005|nr:XapX domain-containing protein [Bacillus sp. Marseille-Q3570]
MKEIALALLSGMAVGVIFKLIRLPIPAPPVLAGVAGIFGVWLGAYGVTVLMEKLTN